MSEFEPGSRAWEVQCCKDDLAMSWVRVVEARRAVEFAEAEHQRASRALMKAWGMES